MTDFKAGDRVKVEFEGTIYRTPPSKSYYEIRDGNALGFVWVVPPESLSLVPPALPTTPGSVVVYKNGMTKTHYFLLDSGKWRTDWSGDSAEVDPKHFEGALIRGCVTIVYDAGA